MLDRKFILENAELVKQNCVNRGVKVDVDRFVWLEEKRKQLQTEVEDLNRLANQVSKSIGQAKDPAQREARKEEGRQLREKNQAVQTEIDAIAVELEKIHRSIPNMSHPQAPVGVDDKSNLELLRGKTPLPKFDFKPLDHVELAEKLDLVDFESGANVTGHGFYFLKNEAVLLELALQQYAVNVLIREGFTPVATPDLAHNSVLEGIGFNPRGPETQIYSIENSDLSLVATAEITLGGMMAGRTFDAENLPLQLCGISHCSAQKPARTAGPRAACIACTNSPRSRCSPLLCPRKAKKCSITSATWNANFSTDLACPIAWSTRPPATWVVRRTANSTWKLGCRAAAKRANSAK
jgi:seryl-tRNA synthetase